MDVAGLAQAFQSQQDHAVTSIFLHLEKDLRLPRSDGLEATAHDVFQELSSQIVDATDGHSSFDDSLENRIRELASLTLRPLADHLLDGYSVSAPETRRRVWAIVARAGDIFVLGVLTLLKMDEPE